jgi:secondary thiamine-phosphate synthase enzyme
MKLQTVKHTIDTRGNTHIVDITPIVIGELEKSKLVNGNICIFIPGSTASVTTIEYEPGLLKDLPEILESIIPSGKPYHHNKTWGDNNGHSHIRAAFFGSSLNVPFQNGELMLGIWQQIVIIDFDERSRKRNFVIQLIGE